MEQEEGGQKSEEMQWKGNERVRECLETRDDDAEKWEGE